MCRVILTNDAAIDLGELYRYIFEHDSPDKADYVLGKIEEALNSLAESPQRGTYLKDLSAIGILDYREIFFKPYRIIYRIIGDEIFVYLIVDGRRNMQTLLERRLLRNE